MFFLELDFGSIAVAALGGMLLSLLVLFIAFLALRGFGVHLLYRKKRPSKKVAEESETPTEDETAINGELTEEELVVILSAAAMEALGVNDAKRFRVVAFRRI